MSGRHWVGLVVGVAAMCTSCPAPAPQLLPRPELTAVKFWACQIRDLAVPGAVEQIEQSRYDLVVLDPARTDISSNETQNFDTAGMVARLQASLSSDSRYRKIVVAHIDIGEAEDSRWYWTWPGTWPSGQPLPDEWPNYILEPDPDGRNGRYPVAYWDSRWKRIVIYGVPDSGQSYSSAMDEVIADGFDGVCLDGVEVFDDTVVAATALSAHTDPAAEMIAFIREIRAYAVQRGKTDFLIVQQNGACLIDGHPELAGGDNRTIDAMIQEAVWFDGNPDATGWDDPEGYDVKNEALLSDYYTGYLAQYQAAGIPVFVCEYAVQHAAEAYAKATAYGFVPYATRRPLSQLTTTPPPGFASRASH